MIVHVALLRGINVGGKHSLPMKQLAAMFAAAGCSGVRTYIQSGNVVFAASPALAARIPALVTASIKGQFGFDAPITIRSADELKAIAKGNPFLRAGADPAALHIAFLADRPGKNAIASLDPHRSPPDKFVVRGREIYLHCPNGMGRSKLTNQYFDSRLATTSTARNWRTVLTLIELAGR